MSCIVDIINYICRMALEKSFEFFAQKNNPTIGRVMGVTMKAVRTALQENLKKAGVALTMEQYLTLKLIELKENINQQDLADLMEKDKSAVLRQINVMQKKQLLTRFPDPHDKRRNILAITKKGVEVYKSALAVEERTMKAIKRGIQDPDLKIFLEVLASIRQNAKAELLK